MYTRNLNGYKIEITNAERGFNILVITPTNNKIYDSGFSLSGSIRIAHDIVSQLRK